MRYGEIEQQIISHLEQAVAAVCAGLNVPDISSASLRPVLEIPKENAHGDLSSNIALRITKIIGKDPMTAAAAVKERFEAAASSSGLAASIDHVEIKPPGFINFFISKEYLSRLLLEIKRTRDRFGSSSMGRGIKLQVEFVSANPTGPLTIAHARQAAIGDALANILEFVGYDVTREYYLNDEGTQMNILGNSVRVRYRNLCGVSEEFPADGYKGSYIADIARDFKKRYGKRYAAASADNGIFREFGLRWLLRDIKDDLKAFDVRFDVWYSQKTLRKSGKIKKAVTLLKERGYIYESEGAVWFKSTAFGDDKDRVIFKSDGSPTYLAPDIAYHLDKYKRGFKRIIDIWGPDHHGYVPRMKAAIQALGYDLPSLTVLIVQLATLYRSGQVVSMSTRAGEFITLREVREEVGKDVARFCFLMRRISSHLDFDIDSVKKESQENPVYYIQYAHARIWSLLGYARKIRFTAHFDSSLLKEAEEIELLRILRKFPLVVALAAQSSEPYMVLQYLQELASAFHSFYNKHRVVSDDKELTRARLVLVDCIRIVLANGLGLLGVSMPKKM